MKMTNKRSIEIRRGSRIQELSEMRPEEFHLELWGDFLLSQAGYNCYGFPKRSPRTSVEKVPKPQSLYWAYRIKG